MQRLARCLVASWSKRSASVRASSGIDVQQIRHKPFYALDRPRSVVVACPPMKSNVNLSAIARTSSCFGIKELIVCGNPSLLAKITRNDEADGKDENDYNLDTIKIDVRRSLEPRLEKLKAEGYKLVALEQTNKSHILFDYKFDPKTVIIVGNEKLGLSDKILNLVDDCVEIPIYGLPHSFNVSHALAMTLYEYCKQYPRG
eukprot:TRINITY_DN10133_c0_g1_i1.p1 TRINITY_DN10133_c0_g1~~TRINITY_DN10133_c0_g1_i1.p1  ORF type:complete len:201 (-),score=24.49 TRINITY_DN10133_c0_g1_i1:33-635(-)